MFNDHFPKFSEPEILITPIEGVVLQMKAMGIEKIASFPFPTPPKGASIGSAMRSLRNIGALDTKEHVTALGRSIARFPVSPRYAKMLVLAHRCGVLPWVVTIVSAMSVHDLFSPALTGNGGDPDDDARPLQLSRRVRELWGNPDSDFLSALKAVEACRHALQAGETLATFSTRHGLRQQSLDEILKLRAQLVSILSEPLSGLNQPPTATQQALIR
jgi:ATP-dependent RNA helicase DHX37/DHR1